MAVSAGTLETAHNMPTHIHCARNMARNLQQTDLLVEVSGSASRDRSFCPLLSLAHLPVFVNMTWVTANEALRSLGLCEGRAGSTVQTSSANPGEQHLFSSLLSSPVQRPLPFCSFFNSEISLSLVIVTNNYQECALPCFAEDPGCIHSVYHSLSIIWLSFHSFIIHQSIRPYIIQ